MRRVLVLLVVLGMWFALPVAAANAQDGAFEVEIHADASRVGADARGCDVSEGGFEVLFDGQVVETGELELTSCLNADGSIVHYWVTYVDDSTGNVVYTSGVGFLVDADLDAGLFTYALRERIVSSSDGTTGRAQGTAFVTATEDGFDVSWWNHWRLRA